MQFLERQKALKDNMSISVPLTPRISNNRGASMNPGTNMLAKWMAKMLGPGGGMPGGMPSGMPPTDPLLDADPMSEAISKYGPGAGAMPQTAGDISQGGAVGGGATVEPSTDEDMLSQVQQSMGGDVESGDMEADAAALVDMYENGDPSDPNTIEDWRVAKQDFVAKYGKENLPELPNDPEPDSDMDDQAKDTRGDY